METTMNEHEGHDLDCGHETECACGEIDGVCGRDFPCCTHDNPLQTAHNQSREGA